MCLTSLIQKKKKKMNVNVIMSAFFPKYACHFLLAYFYALLDKFRHIYGCTFFRNDAKRNIATPIGDVLHHC